MPTIFCAASKWSPVRDHGWDVLRDVTALLASALHVTRAQAIIHCISASSNKVTDSVREAHVNIRASPKA
jgi:hypothetical protein